MTWKEAVEALLQSETNKVVSINLEKAEVNYSDAIRKWEDPKAIRGDEEIIRAFLINRLVNHLDYKPQLIEIEKPYSIGHPSSSQAQIDVIVRDPEGKAFYFIEAKAPGQFENDKKLMKGQLFDLAKQEKKDTVRYLVYYSCDYQEGELIDKAIIIDFAKFSEWEDWESAGYPSTANLLVPGYEKPRKQPKIKGDQDNDLITQINRDELHSLATNLHNVLWGGGGVSDTEIFYSLVNIILAKIQDESEKEDGQEYDFQIYAYGDSIENAENVFERVNGLYCRALREKLNITDDRRLSKAFVVHEEKFPLNKLVYTVQALENFSFIEGRNSLDGRDILGDFFERITREGFKQTKGQFFTPTQVVRFILYALKLDKLAVDQLNGDWQKLPLILDPSVGSGTFLIEAMKIITKEVKYKQRDKLKSSRKVQEAFDNFFMPDYKENCWAREYLYGSEINFDLGTASKVNMILHGDGSSNIFVMDGLLPFNFYTKDKTTSSLQVRSVDPLYFEKEVNEEFDVVVSNPPFSVDLDSETKKYLDRSFLYGSKKNSENLFIERWYQVLKEGGRLGVVLPESVFDTTENKYIRLFLFKYFNVKAIVSLPQLTFKPYTSTKTILLFAQKKTREEVERWNDLWREYGEEWARLRTRVENYSKVYLEGKDKARLPSIRDHAEATIKTNIQRYLKNYVTNGDEDLEIKELLQKYQEALVENGKYDSSIADTFGYYNPWWVFGEVTKHLDYNIFMAEADNVGYKRSKRGEKLMPNDLYDEEIAPMFIPRDDILKAYDERIQHFESLEAVAKPRE